MHCFIRTTQQLRIRIDVQKNLLLFLAQRHSVVQLELATGLPFVVFPAKECSVGLMETATCGAQADQICARKIFGDAQV
jgi:hypothetical protein